MYYLNLFMSENQEIRKLKTSEIIRLSEQDFKSTPKLPVVLVLDNIRSSHNVGSAFRSADAFLVEQIFLCGITSTPPSNEIHKAALGAENSVKWRYFGKTTEAIKSLIEENFLIVAVEQTTNSINLQNFKSYKNFSSLLKIAFIFGNEVSGVDQEVLNLCDLSVEIPQWGTKHSLNVSVAVGIILWEINNQIIRTS